MEYNLAKTGTEWLLFGINLSKSFSMGLDIFVAYFVFRISLDSMVMAEFKYYGHYF
jgi:hypothetical protein